uniref:ribonuclease H n=1 Tax=Sparus aurata TaxID=8175 RepID=A0A671YR74_SPAAU
MVSEDIQSLLDSFLVQSYPQNTEGVELCLVNINHVFHHLASLSNLKCKTKQPKKMNRERWFDSDCKTIRKTLRKVSNLKHRNPDSQELCLSYCETLKQYKNTLRTKKEQYLQNQLQLIEESLGSNQFWENWNSFSKKRFNEQLIQNGDTWKNHFEDLYRKQPKNQAQEQISEKLKDLERVIKNYQTPLDYPITELELEDKLKILQPKTACGPDGILNEMLKYSSRKCKLAILKIFNLVLRVGHFPESWSEGLITPIFKNGDKFDPNNYRGICVSSNLGKLFGSILNSRIMDFLTEHSVLSKSQIGFLPNYRTADHIFTLQTLIDKYVNKNKETIHACFVDFQKAFDSVWHEGLLFKLIESGIGGKSFDVIKSIYEKNKIGDKHTDFFPQGRGVKQGCNLSPTLFNIYINELALLLEQSPAPGLTLQDTEIQCLFYADDLVILSPTKEGLQQNLDLLHQYCQNWALSVNMKKTKIITFQKRSRFQRNEPTFKIGGTHIEQTNTYTYLGLQINSTGNLCSAVKELKEKAKRAFYAIKRSVQIQIPIRTWLKIFNSVIEPIALYGSEVWGSLVQHDWAKWDKNPIETLHTEFCKSILRVQRKTPNSACRAELGQFPLLLNIQKRSIKFWSHIKTSDPASYHYKALAYQELNIEGSPHSQLVLRLADLSPSDITNPGQPQSSYTITQKIRPNQIITKEKEKYTTYWNDITRSQHKLETYLTLNRQYTVAEYLTTVTDQNLRKTLTMYRLSDHSLAVEKGRHHQTWLPREDRLCCHCDEGAIETELHFLTQCHKYRHIREEYFPQFEKQCPEFRGLTEREKLPLILGEKKECAVLAAKYVTSCHNKRDNQ